MTNFWPAFILMHADILCICLERTECSFIFFWHARESYWGWREGVNGWDVWGFPEAVTHVVVKQKDVRHYFHCGPGLMDFLYNGKHIWPRTISGVCHNYWTYTLTSVGLQWGLIDWVTRWAMVGAATLRISFSTVNVGIGVQQLRVLMCWYYATVDLSCERWEDGMAGWVMDGIDEHHVLAVLEHICAQYVVQCCVQYGAQFLKTCWGGHLLHLCCSPSIKTSVFWWQYTWHC